MASVRAYEEERKREERIRPLEERRRRVEVKIPFINPETATREDIMNAYEKLTDVSKVTSTKTEKGEKDPAVPAFIQVVQNGWRDFKRDDKFAQALLLDLGYAIRQFTAHWNGRGWVMSNKKDDPMDRQSLVRYRDLQQEINKAFLAQALSRRFPDAHVQGDWANIFTYTPWKAIFTAVVLDREDYEDKVAALEGLNQAVRAAYSDKENAQEYRILGLALVQAVSKDVAEAKAAMKDDPEQRRAFDLMTRPLLDKLQEYLDSTEGLQTCNATWAEIKQIAQEHQIHELLGHHLRARESFKTLLACERHLVETAKLIATITQKEHYGKGGAAVLLSKH